MTAQRYDVCVIGAGSDGCATALELKNPHWNWKKNLSVAVIEKNSHSGQEASSHNSGILHPAFHQPPTFLKARLAREGSILARQFAKEHNIPLLETGMLIVVPTDAVVKDLRLEWKNFWILMRRGRANGVHFNFLTPWGVRKLESHIHALCGIFIPEVAVIDSERFVKALEEKAKAFGVEFFYNDPVIDIKLDGAWYRVITRAKEFQARVVINAAGIYADEIANKALNEKKYTLYPWRGEYYEIISEKKHFVQRIICPVMPPHSPSKGILVSPRPDGRVFIGPNAVQISSKTDYESNKTPVDVFLKAGKSFLSELDEFDLRWGYAGIRAKLSDTAEENDFLINVDHINPTLINHIGIDSPGLSAAGGIARYTCALLPSSFFK